MVEGSFSDSRALSKGIDFGVGLACSGHSRLMVSSVTDLFQQPVVEASG